MFISVMGDSISTFTGSVPAGWSVFYDTLTARQAEMLDIRDVWWRQVTEWLGGIVIANDSYSGSLVSGSSFPAACGARRLDAIRTPGQTPDVVLVYIGINDFGFVAPLGTPREEAPVSKNEFYGAYRLMLRGMAERCPDARILCGTLLRGHLSDDPLLVLPETNTLGKPLDAYNDAIRAAVAAEGAELVDLASATDADGVPLTYQSLDCVHPTRAGHRTLARAWIDRIG